MGPLVLCAATRPRAISFHRTLVVVVDETGAASNTLAQAARSAGLVGCSEQPTEIAATNRRAPARAVSRPAVHERWTSADMVAPSNEHLSQPDAASRSRLVGTRLALLAAYSRDLARAVRGLAEPARYSTPSARRSDAANCR